MSVLLAAALAASLSDCDAAVRDAPEDYQSYDCYRSLARSRGAWDGAVERLDALLARDSANTLARVVLARIESDRGRPRAEELFRAAADEFAASAMPVGEVFARLDLAFWLRRLGRLDESAAEVERARASASASGLPLLLSNVRAEEAWIAEARADYGRAYALFRETEAEVLPAGPLQVQYSVLGGIGSTLWAMGRHAESIGYYRRLAEAHRARGDLFAEAGDLYNVALLAGKLAQEGAVSGDERARLRHEALRAAVESGNRGVESAIRMMIGEDPALPLASRLRETERALALAEEVGDEGKALFSLRELARLRLTQDPDHPEAAYRLADEAVRRGRATGDPAALARGLFRRSQIAWIMAPRARALDEAREALDAIERIRDLQRDELVRARVGSEWADYYYQFSGWLLREPSARSASDLELAFSVMERLRGRVLLEALDAAQATPALAGTGPVQEVRAEVLKEIGHEQQRLLDAALGAEERKEVIERLERLEAQESVLRDTLLRSDPEFAALHRPVLPTLADLGQALGREEALLAFQITDSASSLSSPALLGRSFVFVVTRGGTSVHSLPDEGVLAQRISLYLGFLGRRDGSDREGALSLHRDLFEGALGDLPPEVTRLVIVPDKVLFRLPFDALLDARYEVSIAPSAALWLRWRRAGSRAAPIPALVLADPENAGASLGPLPHARREARAIVRALGSGSTAVVGTEASEAFLATAELGRYGVLHFAAHAVIDDVHPERSALLLAPGDGTQDGLLHVREIVGYDLGGAVVVLSACRSTAGALLRGEGTMSLARGFFQAGARAVVGGLAPLRDDEAAAFVSAFYEHLSRGLAVGSALAQARRDLLQAGAPAASWAGWVVMGDASAVPVPGGARGTWWWAWLLAALLLGVGVRSRISRSRLPRPRDSRPDPKVV